MKQKMISCLFSFWMERRVQIENNAINTIGKVYDDDDEV